MIAKVWTRAVPPADGGAPVLQRVLVTARFGGSTYRGGFFRQGRWTYTVRDITAKHRPVLGSFSSEDACRFWLLDAGFRPRGEAPATTYTQEEAS